jgi:hypothetical protein
MTLRTLATMQKHLGSLVQDIWSSSPHPKAAMADRETFCWTLQKGQVSATPDFFRLNLYIQNQRKPLAPNLIYRPKWLSFVLFTRMLSHLKEETINLCEYFLKITYMHTSMQVHFGSDEPLEGRYKRSKVIRYESHTQKSSEPGMKCNTWNNWVEAHGGNHKETKSK